MGCEEIGLVIFFIITFVVIFAAYGMFDNPYDDLY